VAVESSEDISAEPVRGQKIEEHVVTDLDLRNYENRPMFNQWCSSRTSRSIIEKSDRWDGWRYHGRQRYRSLTSHYTGKMREYWSKNETGTFWHCNEKLFSNRDVPQQKWQKLVMAMYHKSYSSPEPQRRSSW